MRRRRKQVKSDRFNTKSLGRIWMEMHKQEARRFKMQFVAVWLGVLDFTSWLLSKKPKQSNFETRTWAIQVQIETFESVKIWIT